MRYESLRALLFVPATPRMLAKIPELEADAIIVDLEDAIPPGEKTEARRLAATSLSDIANAERVVRVNSDPATLTDDLDAIVGPDLDAVMLPKVASVAALEWLSDRLAHLEAARSLEPSQVKILALIESALGVASAEAIAAGVPDRLVGLCFGPGDLAADLRVTPSADGSELAYARSRVVVAARAAGLPSPIDGPFPAIRDLDGLTADSARSAASGFQGRLVLHPSHVDPVRRAYSGMSEEDLSFAARVVAAFDDHRARGIGTVVVDDLFVDEPVYRRYRAMLHTATSSGAPVTTGTGS